ncbi:MAG: CDP-glucose 4,6-dehydratase [Bacteroidota bacterium]
MKPVDFSLLRGRRVLVTGSTGFKGSWLCTWLLGLGAEVSGLALEPAADAPLFGQLGLGQHVRQHFGDIRDAAFVDKVMAEEQPEIVLHLAAQALVRVSFEDPRTTFETNVSGAVNLLEAVRRCDSLRALVFITSDKCYRNKEWIWGYRENDELGGSDPYSASKACAELVFTSYQESFLQARPRLGAVTARAGNVIGGGDMSRDRIVPDCIRALKAGQPIVLRNPASTRPWQHVLEPLSGYLSLAIGLLADERRPAGAWNFGPDAENVRTVGELAQRLTDLWGGSEVRVERDPNAPHEANLLMLSNDKAKTLLGWRPRWSFEQAAAETLLWYKRVAEGEDPLAVTNQQIAAYMAVTP